MANTADPKAGGKRGHPVDGLARGIDLIVELAVGEHLQLVALGIES
jgi:hypothetical protein